MQRDEATLLDILRAAKLALEFRGDLSFAELSRDLKTRSSVLHQLMILGEATKRLSQGFRKEISDIPWRRIAGMRDLLIHAYDEVDLETVWQTLERDLPRLIETLEDLAPS